MTHDEVRLSIVSGNYQELVLLNYIVKLISVMLCRPGRGEISHSDARWVETVHCTW